MRPTLEQIAAIAPDFNSRYQILIADTEALKRDVYRVRCQVFCNELGYWDDRNGVEHDEFDANSIQVLLRQRNTGTPVGCFRIVKPKAHGTWLPFQLYGDEHVDPQLLDWNTVDRERSVEISRLAIIASKRQALKDGRAIGASDPYLATALFYAVTAMVVKLKVSNVFMFIEPPLGRLTSRFGIRLDQIGRAFECYGQRAVFSTTGARMKYESEQLLPAWRALYDVVAPQLVIENTVREVA